MKDPDQLGAQNQYICDGFGAAIGLLKLQFLHRHPQPAAPLRLPQALSTNASQTGSRKPVRTLYGVTAYNHAVALFTTCYNFICIHKTLRVTPAMAE